MCYYCFNFCSIFIVLISVLLNIRKVMYIFFLLIYVLFFFNLRFFLLNIGMEMSLQGFRKIQSNFNGSNIIGTMEILFEVWVVRATEG